MRRIATGSAADGNPPSQENVDQNRSHQPRSRGTVFVERLRFTDEFKTGAVRLVLEEGKTVGAVARDLDLTESSLRKWVEQAQADRTKGRTGLTTAEREELARLRKENRILQEERDILTKATAFFAKQSR